MTNTISESAKIYTFPRRGRFALHDQHQDFASAHVDFPHQDFAPSTNTQLPRAVKLVSGSGWYHDAAIQEASKADMGRKN
jgi:hypothetical protein